MSDGNKLDRFGPQPPNPLLDPAQSWRVDQSVRYLFAIGLGALGGAIVGVLIWRAADQALRAEFASGGDVLAQSLAQGQAQLSAQASAGRTAALAAVGTAIQTQVVPAVRAGVDQQLRTNGITPGLIAQVQSALNAAHRLRVI